MTRVEAAAKARTIRLARLQAWGSWQRSVVEALLSADGFASPRPMLRWQSFRPLLVRLLNAKLTIYRRPGPRGGEATARYFVVAEGGTRPTKSRLLKWNGRRWNYKRLPPSPRRETIFVVRPLTPEEVVARAERRAALEAIEATKWSEYNRKFNALFYGEAAR